MCNVTSAQGLGPPRLLRELREMYVAPDDRDPGVLDVVATPPIHPPMEEEVNPLPGPSHVREDAEYRVGEVDACLAATGVNVVQGRPAGLSDSESDDRSSSDDFLPTTRNYTFNKMKKGTRKGKGKGKGKGHQAKGQGSDVEISPTRQSESVPLEDPGTTRRARSRSRSPGRVSPRRESPRRYKKATRDSRERRRRPSRQSGEQDSDEQRRRREQRKRRVSSSPTERHGHLEGKIRRQGDDELRPWPISNYASGELTSQQINRRRQGGILEEYPQRLLYPDSGPDSLGRRLSGQIVAGVFPFITHVKGPGAGRKLVPEYQRYVEAQREGREFTRWLQAPTFIDNGRRRLTSQRIPGARIPEGFESKHQKEGRIPECHAHNPIWIGRCVRCGGEDHIARECRKQCWCKYCWSNGHNIAFCTRLHHACRR